MKAARVSQPNVLEIVELPIPEPGPDDILIRVMSSGICGTDIHILRGEYLGDYPVVPGHEFSGEVVGTGHRVTRLTAGDRVAVEPNIACDNCPACLNNRQNFCHNWQAVGVTRPGGMAQYVVAPEKAVFPIGDLPYEAGAFMEPLSCVLHGVQRLSPEIAAEIAIIGAGPIGCLLLQALRARGASRCTMVDRNETRLETAAELGADECVTSLASLRRDHYDAVVDATGAISVMSQTIEYARHGGQVLLFGVPPSGHAMSLDAFSIFRKGLTILSSFTSVRNSLQALRLLQSGAIRMDKLISHLLPLEELESGIGLIEHGAEGVRKVMIQPNI
jgi:2-desacetyl-2-hydroxyethyl bacteriochlorophyllide A dehydrogenase